MTPSAAKVLRMPARLIASPTSMSTDAPYGGTYLGLARDIKIAYGYSVSEIIDEGYADEHHRQMLRGVGISAACLLRGWDPDAVQKILFNTSLGTWNDRKSFNAPKSAVSGYVRPGGWLTSKKFKLLIAPEDEARHQFVVIYNACAILADDAAIDFHENKELAISVKFVGTPDTDATARKYDIARKGSLTL